MADGGDAYYRKGRQWPWEQHLGIQNPSHYALHLRTITVNGIRIAAQSCRLTSAASDGKFVLPVYRAEALCHCDYLYEP
jgi:hypothetical protein